MNTSRPLNLAVVLLALTLAAAPAAWAAPKAQDAPPKLKVIGQATLRFQPDQLEVTVGVENQAPTAAQAARANSAAMDKVMAALKRALSQKATLQTISNRLYAVRQWDKERQASVVTGYQAQNLVRVTARDQVAVGQALDAAVKAGANRVDGPTWGLSDQDAAFRKAQAAALADAGAQARGLAAAAGLKLGRLLSVAAKPAGGDARPMLAMAAKNDGPNLEPGLIEVSAEVECRFLLAPAR